MSESMIVQPLSPATKRFWYYPQNEYLTDDELEALTADQWELFGEQSICFDVPVGATESEAQRCLEQALLKAAPLP